MLGADTAIVTLADPLYDVPESPLPIVKAFGLLADTVIGADPSKDTPLIVVATFNLSAVDAFPIKLPERVVAATEVSPVIVDTEPPSAMFVDPRVIEELINAVLGICEKFVPVKKGTLLHKGAFVVDPTKTPLFIEQDSRLGTPEELVVSTELLEVLNWLIVFTELAYNRLLTVTVFG